MMIFFRHHDICFCCNMSGPFFFKISDLPDNHAKSSNFIETFEKSLDFLVACAGGAGDLTESLHDTFFPCSRRRAHVRSPMATVDTECMVSRKSDKVWTQNAWSPVKVTKCGHRMRGPP